MPRVQVIMKMVFFPYAQSHYDLETLFSGRNMESGVQRGTDCLRETQWNWRSWSGNCRSFGPRIEKGFLLFYMFSSISIYLLNIVHRYGPLNIVCLNVVLRHKLHLLHQMVLKLWLIWTWLWRCAQGHKLLSFQGIHKKLLMPFDWIDGVQPATFETLSWEVHDYVWLWRIKGQLSMLKVSNILIETRIPSIQCNIDLHWKRMISLWGHLATIEHEHNAIWNLWNSLY